MESRLVYLETLCCQCEQAALKQHHMNELEVYKKKKGYEIHITHSLVSYEADFFPDIFNVRLSKKFVKYVIDLKGEAL